MKPTKQALMLAAQAWCDPETKHTVMDPALAEAFARRLTPLLAVAKAARRLADREGTDFVRFSDVDAVRKALARLERVSKEKR